MSLNGTNLAASASYSSPILDVLDPSLNGFDEPPIELLEAELPVVDDGQVPLSELVSRVVQACYAEMTEMAETSVFYFVFTPGGSLYAADCALLFSSVFLACQTAPENASWLTLWSHGRNRWSSSTPSRSGRGTQT